MLFTWIPVPGTTTPEPHPVDAESDAAFPSPSTTLMWVVDGSPAGSVTLPRSPLRTASAARLNRLVREDAPCDPAAIQATDEPRATDSGRLAHDLGQGRYLAGAPRALRLAQPVEHPQCESHQQTARRGRRVRDELASAIGDPDGPAPDDAVGRQIIRRNPASLLLHRGREQQGELAAVEGCLALFRELLERRSELTEVEGLPRGKPAGFPVDGTGSGTVSEDRVEYVVQKPLGLVQKHAAPGELNGRLEQDGPGQACVEAVSLREPGDGTGDCARCCADQERLCGRPVEGDIDLFHGHSVLVRETLSRHRHEEVEHRVGAPSTCSGPVHEQEAAAARAGQRALGDPGDTGSCDAGIDRVSAFGEDARAGLGGQRMSGRNCALHRKSVDG